MKILVADDDLTTRTFLKLCLEKSGHTVIQCENGEQALDQLSDPDGPNLAILDWEMPHKSGLEVITRLRQKLNLLQKYIIVLSGKSHQRHIVKALSAGANDYIVKPFFYDELIARIQIGVNTIVLQKEVAALRELLPICAWCKSIKTTENYWETLETYFSNRHETKFTHGICTPCQHKLKKKPEAG